MNQNIKPFKVSLVGEYNAGKSAIHRRFHDGTFNPSCSTIGLDFAVKIVQASAADEGSAQICGKMQLWDFAASERFCLPTQSFFRGCDAILLVFDLSSQHSFLEIPRWIHYTGLNAQCNRYFLVGAKSDLSPPVVSEEEAKDLADQFGMPYFETSSKLNIGLEKLFQVVADDVLLFPEHRRLCSSTRSGNVKLPAQGEVIPRRGSDATTSSGSPFSSC